MFSLLVGIAAPFKDTSDDYFAKACSFALTMLFFFVTVLKMGVLTEQVDSVLTDELRYRFSFDAAFVSGGMILSIVGTLPVAAVIAAHRLFQAARVQEAACCSERSAAAIGVQQSSARADTMHGWSRAKGTLASLRSTRSVIRQACPAQERARSSLPPSLPAPTEPGGALGTGVEANLNHTRRLIVRPHGEPPNAAVDESEAAMHAANAPTYVQGRPPAVTPLPPRSQGKLRAEEVEEPPRDRKARLKARREEMTAGDASYKDAAGIKEGPGRLSRCHRLFSPCSASESKGSSCGASPSSNDIHEPVRV